MSFEPDTWSRRAAGGMGTSVRVVTPDVAFWDPRVGAARFVGYLGGGSLAVTLTSRASVGECSADPPRFEGASGMVEVRRQEGAWSGSRVLAAVSLLRSLTERATLAEVAALAVREALLVCAGDLAGVTVPGGLSLDELVTLALLRHGEDV